jgi:tetratricopeptide (TPR) repeat protein
MELCVRRAATIAVMLFASWTQRSDAQSIAVQWESTAPDPTGDWLADLPGKRTASPSSETTISLQQLQHKVPAMARKAFQNGERAGSRGQLDQARGFFEEAVAIDPEFSDAFNELGAAEAGMKRLPQAAEHFQRAVDLAPEHPRALPNLSIALMQMKRYQEAGEVARRALKAVPNSALMHYVVAVSVLAGHGDVNEAITHFERAANDVPVAHLTAAKLLARSGRSQEAIRHLEEYLRCAAPDDAQRLKVVASLAQLRQ